MKIDKNKFKYNLEVLKSLKVNMKCLNQNLSFLGYNLNDPNLSYHYVVCSNDFNFKDILELGTGSSEFTYFLSERFKKSKIVSIDNYLSSKEVSFKNRTNFLKRKVYKKKNVTFIKSDTSIILKLKKKFDFILVDADHHFPKVNEDIIDSLAVLKKNGTLIVDDIVKVHFENEFISNASYLFLNELEKINKIKVKYLYKRVGKTKINKYIAVVNLI